MVQSDPPAAPAVRASIFYREGRGLQEVRGLQESRGLQSPFSFASVPDALLLLFRKLVNVLVIYVALTFIPALIKCPARETLSFSLQRETLCLVLQQEHKVSYISNEASVPARLYTPTFSVRFSSKPGIKGS